MEKIRNLLNPGAKQDNEVMYGSGQSSDPVHSGQGSHFGSSRTADGSDNPLSSSQPTSNTGTSALGGASTSTGRSVGNEGLTGSSGVGSSNTYDPATSDSRMPGAFDDGSSTAEIRSGVPGRNVGEPGLSGSSSLNKPLPNEPGTSSLGSGSNTTGPHSSSLENKLDPRVDSNLDGSRSLGSNTGTGASGSGLTGSNYPDRSVENSGYENPSRTGNSGSSFGRDAAVGGTGLGAAEAAHHHHNKQQYDQDSLGSGTGTGRSFPLGGNSNTSSTDPSTGNPGYNSNTTGSSVQPATGSSHLGRDAGLAGAGFGGAGLAERHRERETNNPVSSTGTGSNNAEYGSSARNPDYNSNVTGSGTQPTTGSSHLGRDAGLAGAGLGGAGLAERHRERGTNDPISGTGTGSNAAGYGPESWQHEHGSHGHEYAGDPCGPEATTSGPHFVEGPHATDTANRLDPHVSGNGAGAGIHGHGHHGKSTPGSAIGSTGSKYDDQRGDRHLGRDATIGGTAAGAGVGAYEADRHHPDTSSSTGNAQSSTGPVHKSSLLNKIDPRVKQQNTDTIEGGSEIGGSRTAGQQNEPLTGTSSQHHYGRDAAIGAGVAGAGYEAEKHHHSKEPATENTSQHQYGRDAAVGTGVAGTGYEAERHHHNKDPATSQHHYGRDAAIGTGVAGAGYEAEKHHQKKEDFTSGLAGTTAGTGHDQRHGATDSSTYPSSRYDNSQATGTHHYGRDAAIGAGAVGAGGVAGSEFSKKDAEEEQKQLARQEENRDRLVEQDHNHQQKDYVHHQKEIAKEEEKGEKQHEKAIAKDEKHHEKDLAKAEKQHEKAIAKDEKHHEKDLAKAEKQHEKEVKQEEKHEGKKHGGLLGLFHRDKPDKDLKEEQAEQTGATSHRPAEAGLAAGAVGAAGLTERERHEHERNRLHKDPPASVANAQNTEYADAPQSGYASQVTGGTGTSALAQGDSVQRGSHLSGVGNKLDPAVANRGDTLGSDNQNIESRIGLPVDYSKGDGRYGTDDTPTPGQHTMAGDSGSDSAAGTSGVTGASGHHNLHHSGEVNSSFPGAPGTHDGYEPGAGNIGSGTGRY